MRSSSIRSINVLGSLGYPIGSMDSFSLIEISSIYKKRAANSYFAASSRSQNSSELVSTRGRSLFLTRITVSLDTAHLQVNGERDSRPFPLANLGRMRGDRSGATKSAASRAPGATPRTGYIRTVACPANTSTLSERGMLPLQPPLRRPADTAIQASTRYSDLQTLPTFGLEVRGITKF